MQTNLKPVGKTGFNNFAAKAATPARTASKPAAAVGAAGAKKTTGEVLFRVKRKAAEGVTDKNGNQIKWETIGALYQNTDSATGDVFYSFSTKEGIEPGLHKVFDNTPPAGTQVA